MKINHVGRILSLGVLAIVLGLAASSNGSAAINPSNDGNNTMTAADQGAQRCAAKRAGSPSIGDAALFVRVR